MQFVPYLNFDGECEAAFKFYEQHFGGKIVAMFTQEDAPDGCQIPAEWAKRIMHAVLIVGDAVLMGCDMPPGSPAAPGNIQVSLMIDTPEEAERIFHALADGGTVKFPIQETFWAVRFGTVDDRFGIPWMINCEKAH